MPSAAAPSPKAPAAPDQRVDSDQVEQAQALRVVERLTEVVGIDGGEVEESSGDGGDRNTLRGSQVSRS